MFFKSLALAATAATAATAAALPRFPVAPGAHSVGARAATTNSTTSADSGFQQVVYWGQNDNEKDLGEYCADTEGIDILVLSFISTYGSKSPSGNFGSDCSTDQECQKLEDDVKTCKAAGKKIFVSLGGAGASGDIASEDDANKLAQDLWDSYGNPASASNKDATRPLGSQIIDGFDIDVESKDSAGNENYKTMLTKLRSLFEADKSQQYYISGAPQCPLPEENMGGMIQDSKFDLLFIQFYNNDPCSANSYRDGDKSSFNFDDWNTYAAKGASKGAKLFIGLPAGKKGANDEESGEKYFLEPNDMSSLVNEYKSHAGFAGVMLWDAGNSDTVNENGCHYSGEVKSVLSKGTTC